MPGDGGHPRAMRLLPFPAAAETACLTIECQIVLSDWTRARSSKILEQVKVSRRYSLGRDQLAMGLRRAGRSRVRAG
jgi:hypothetical protein